MYFVYYLQSIDYPNQTYIGFSSDVGKRFIQHNNGESQSTKRYIPWRLIYYEAFSDKKDATRREKYLKTSKGRRALKLMLKFSYQK